MKLTIKDHILNVLTKHKNIKKLKRLAEKVKSVSGTKWTVGRIETYIVESFERDHRFENFLITLDSGICSRSELFKGTKFKIKLTVEEFNEKKLYIGHRFLPFILDFFEQSKIQLTDKDKNKINKKQDKLPIIDGMKYLIFLKTYLWEDKENFDSQNIVLSYFDLTDWMKKNSFNINDCLQITVLDIDTLKYKIEKISAKEYNAQSLLLKSKDAELEESILEQISLHEINDISLTLFRAFAELDEDIVKEPGSPISILINESEAVNYQEMGGNPVLIDADSSLFEHFMDNMEDELPEPGKSKSMEGILKELGNGFSENFIQALMIVQLKKDGNIDDEKLLKILFKRPPFFYNEKQADNFVNAYEKIKKTVIKNWKNKDIDKFVFQLIEIIVKIQTNINSLLRAVDDYLNKSGDEDFDFQMLESFQSIDFAAEEMMFQILENKANIPTIDAKKIYDQFENLYKTIFKDIEAIKEDLLKKL